MLRPVALLAAVGLLASIVHGCRAQPTGAAPAGDARSSISPAPRPDDPARLTLHTDRLVVFKDGYALVVKSAMATPGPDGQVFTDEVPDAAVLGCFWAVADGRPITTMRAEWVENTSERSRETACTSIVEILRANTGKPVTLALNSPFRNTEFGAPVEKGSITGTIATVLELPPEPRRPFDPDLVNLSPEEREAHLRARALAGMAPTTPPDLRGEFVRPLIPTNSNLVVIDQQGGGRIILPIADVRAVDGPALVTTTTRREEVTLRHKRLSFDLGEPRPGAGSLSSPANLTIIYFTAGIRWIPTYRVGGELKTDAVVNLQAELLNELEDIDGAALDLVVGVPSFRFKGVISPMSLERELRNALIQAAPQLMGRQQQFSNAMFQQRASEYTANSGPADTGLGMAPELAAPGSGEQDLFVYSIADGKDKRFALKKGARATVPLWESTVPVRHVYTMDVTVRRNQRSPSEPYSISSKYDARFGGTVAPSPSESPLKLGATRVWHQLELKNTTTVPWTTGAALLIRGHIPLGQDMLTYTPVKGSTLLPVTVAMDVQGLYKEVELDRKPDALRWDGNSFALVHKRATITLSNYRSEPSDLKITLSLGGKVGEVSEKGVLELNDFHSDDWGDNTSDYRPNNHSDVTWELSVEPGKTATLTAEFTIFVR